MMDAFREKEQAREIAAVAKWRREAQACWLTLIQALRVRTQLQADYVTTPNANAASTSDAAAAAGKGKQPAKGRAAAAVAAATGAAAAAAASGGALAAGGAASAAGAAAATAAAAELAAALTAAADATSAVEVAGGEVQDPEDAARVGVQGDKMDVERGNSAGSSQQVKKRARKSAVASTLQRLQLPQASAVVADTSVDDVEDI